MGDSYSNIMVDNQSLILNQQNAGNDIMQIKHYSSPVVSVHKGATLDQVLLKMQLNHIKTTLVTLEEKPVGIITETDIVKFLESRSTKALDEIPVAEVMKDKVISIADGQQDQLNQCAQRMQIFKIGAVIIVDDDGKIMGITTKTDITNAYSMMYPRMFKVKDFMTKKVTTCRKSDSILYALNMINKNGISRLVVTDKFGRPQRIVSRNTFLKHANNFKKGSRKTADYWNPTKLDSSIPLEKILNDDLLVVDLEDDLAEAASMMIKNLISGIPVIDKKGNLVGIVTKSDIVRAFSQVESDSALLEKYKQAY